MMATTQNVGGLSSSQADTVTKQHAGTVSQGFVRWRGTYWEPMPRLPADVAYTTRAQRHPDGRLYLSYQTSAFKTRLARLEANDTWTDLTPQIPEPGEYFVLDPAGRFVTFAFVRFPNGSFARRVARFDGARWDTLAGDFTSTILRLGLDGRGQPVVFGKQLNMARTPQPPVVRWTGTAWQPLVGLDVSGEVWNVAAGPGDALYATGTLPNVGPGVLRWDGAAWGRIGTVAPSTVTALAVDGAGMLYVGGSFNAALVPGTANFARWDGTAWSSPGSVGALSSDGYFNSFAFDGPRLWMGSSVNSAGGVPAHRTTYWEGVTPVASEPEAVPAAPTTGLRLRVAGPNPARTRALLRLDGLPGGLPVCVRAYDLLGRAVATLHEGAWDGAPLVADVSAWTPGLYLVRAETGGASATARLVVVR